MLCTNCQIKIQILVIQYLWSSIMTGPTVYKTIYIFSGPPAMTKVYGVWCLPSWQLTLPCFERVFTIVSSLQIRGDSCANKSRDNRGAWMHWSRGCVGVFASNVCSCRRGRGHGSTWRRWGGHPVVLSCGSYRTHATARHKASRGSFRLRGLHPAMPDVWGAVPNDFVFKIEWNVCRILWSC